MIGPYILTAFLQSNLIKLKIYRFVCLDSIHSHTQYLSIFRIRNFALFLKLFRHAAINRAATYFQISFYFFEWQHFPIFSIVRDFSIVFHGCNVIVSNEMNFFHSLSVAMLAAVISKYKSLCRAEKKLMHCIYAACKTSNF